MTEEKAPKEETFYSESPEVKTIADKLIPLYHTELASANITYLFVSKASKKGGKELSGKVVKLGGLAKHWSGDMDFAVIVAFPVWNSPDMTNSKKVALIDHLLERCTGEEDEKSGDMKWQTREPDVLEFASILERRGAWHENLAEMVDVVQSLGLAARAEEVLDSTES